MNYQELKDYIRRQRRIGRTYWMGKGTVRRYKATITDLDSLVGPNAK